MGMTLSTQSQPTRRTKKSVWTIPRLLQVIDFGACPNAIACDQNNNFAMVSAEPDRACVRSKEGKIWKTKENTLIHPIDVSIYKNFVYVQELYGPIKLLSLECKISHILAHKHDGQPICQANVSDTGILIHTKGRKVVHLSHEGRVIRQFSLRPRLFRTDFDLNLKLYVHGNYIYASDFGADQFHLFSIDGTWIQSQEFELQVKGGGPKCITGNGEGVFIGCDKDFETGVVDCFTLAPNVNHCRRLEFNDKISYLSCNDSFMYMGDWNKSQVDVYALHARDKWYAKAPCCEWT